MRMLLVDRFDDDIENEKAYRRRPHQEVMRINTMLESTDNQDHGASSHEEHIFHIENKPAIKSRYHVSYRTL